MLKKRRIVITGLGCISPVGNSVKKMWNSIKKGKSGINIIKKFDTSLIPIKFAGEVKNFNINNYISVKNSRCIDRFVHFGIASGIQAIKNSNLDILNIDKNRVGIIIGSGFGGISIFEKTYKNFLFNNFYKINPFFITSSIINMISANLSIKYGFKGPNLSITNGCTTALHCIGLAFRMIQYGDADIIIAGGSEASITPLCISSFFSIGALSKRNNDYKTASRPWDKNRDGFVLGEGSGVMILEEYEHAKLRNAKIYAELLGFGMTNDAFHITNPKIEGLVNSINLALLDANINSCDIQYINAHGTSTKIGDKKETDVIKMVFKKYAYDIIINSTKSMTGHLLGASAGIESIITVLALYYQISPPTINIFSQDKECDLDYCANKFRKLKINFAMKNSWGFGGVNGTLIFKKI
ncbi:beta-ketoacyl-ACP synthase II [Candidatus Zinderia endosymbiont of Aphrophora alni]|uniref:beta-ketoacyl-ACP synthase II n=1 Tax=Candidatus Zinderia endosymbiont of Aphrophora alni TaxID=3077951 RepID=UPI0030D29717